VSFFPTSIPAPNGHPRCPAHGAVAINDQQADLILARDMITDGIHRQPESAAPRWQAYRAFMTPYAEPVFRHRNQDWSASNPPTAPTADDPSRRRAEMDEPLPHLRSFDRSGYHFILLDGSTSPATT
jgi:hypothetical protein